MSGTEKSSLVGNRLVLAGAVLYLLEWVAIIAGSVGVPVGAASSTAKVLVAYAGHQDALGWAAGWFSVVLLGRVLIVTGLRSALAASGRPQPLMDLAVAAMAVSVALEVAVYAVAAGASWGLAHGAGPATVRSLDAAAFMLNQVLLGPLGVSLVCAGAAMWRSALFPRVLPLVGLVAGVAMVVAAAAFAAPSYASVSGPLSSSAVLFWVWMLWTGALLWRRAPSRETARALQPVP